MPILPILRLGHPLLREKVPPRDPERIEEPGFQALIDDMVATCRDAAGAGIAAPQVGARERVFLMEVHENRRYPEAPELPLTIVVNPEVTPLDDTMQTIWEGCLSIPGLRGAVPRHRRVRLTGRDRRGARLEMELEGFHAGVAQHELDHLDGVLFIDRMTDLRRLAFLEEWERFHSAGGRVSDVS